MTIAGLVVTAGLAIAQPVSATNTPPGADAGLIGTWGNVTPNSGIAITKIVISSNGGGGIKVDTFANCSAPSCENGNLAAVVFGSTADATTGKFFKTNQSFDAYNKVLLGHLTSTSVGPRIALTRYIVWKDHSRFNSALTAQFARFGTSTGGTTKNGTPASGYPGEVQPTPQDALVGTWTNTNANTRGIAKLIITKTGGGTLLVHAFGKCTPTLCDIGTFPAIAYANDSLSSTGRKFLAPNDAGFKRELYAGEGINGATGLMKVEYYSEFTDSSGRSNYAISENFSQVA